MHLRQIIHIIRIVDFKWFVSQLFLRILRRSIDNYPIYFKYFKNKKGIEIGGPTKIFSKREYLPLYPIVGEFDNCNFCTETVWEGKIQAGKTFKYDQNKKEGYQFICDASQLAGIPYKTYDFVLSSHTLEHIANPLKAVKQWLSVLKDDGLFLLVIPHKDATFDHKRPVTAFSHLLEDFEEDTQEDDLSHLEEILAHHDLRLDPRAGHLMNFRERSLNNKNNRCLHHHVFDTKLVLEIFRYFYLDVLIVDFVFPFHIVVLGQKVPLGHRNNIDGENHRYLSRSPFPSDFQK